MVGINWNNYNQKDFDKIVEVLLRREFGVRGHAVNGRGGDKGVDYSVDDGSMIFQFKFFPEGFSANNPSRQGQIKNSFTTAIKSEALKEWVLVVPATLTPAERRFVTGLGKGKQVKISIRDDIWLTDVLATPENKDLLNNFLYASDIEYLYSRGERFAHNPVIRDSRDLAERTRGLKESIELVDPNYSLELHTVDGQLVQRLVPKDARAPIDAPVSMNFIAEVPEDHPQLGELNLAADYGLAEDFIVGADMIKDLSVTGTSLINESEPGAGFVLPALASGWEPTEIILKDETGRRTAIYLGASRIRSRARAGSRVEVSLHDLVTLVFFIHYGEKAARVDLATRADENATSTAMLESADFLLRSNEAHSIEIRVKKQTVIAAEISDEAPPEMLREAATLRLLADDLRVIESKTLTRFRVPIRISVRDRVTVRNVRLMLEGHCVAHPDATVIRATLNGNRGPGTARMLSTEPMWLSQTSPAEPSDLLGEEIHLAPVSRAALVSLTQEEVDAANTALDSGHGDGHVINFRVRPGDRIRLFLQDLRDPDLPVDIHPWGLPDVEQQGLDSTGEPFTKKTQLEQ